MRHRKNIKRVIFTLCTLSGILILWETAVRTARIPAYLLPPPLRVMTVSIREFPSIFPSILVTMKCVGFGFLSALVTAFASALLMHRYPLMKNILNPLMTVSQTIPLIVLAPLFILWFGFGLMPKILTVVLVCFFPMTVNILDGLDSAHSGYIDLLKTMGAARGKIFFHVTLPAAAAHIFSGLKIAVTYSVIGAVIGEWLGGADGLGVFLVRAQKSFAVEKVFAAIFYITAVSLLFRGAISLIMKKMMPWKTAGLQEKSTKQRRFT